MDINVSIEATIPDELGQEEFLATLKKTLETGFAGAGVTLQMHADEDEVNAEGEADATARKAQSKADKDAIAEQDRAVVKKMSEIPDSDLGVDAFADKETKQAKKYILATIQLEIEKEKGR